MFSDDDSTAEELRALNRVVAPYQNKVTVHRNPANLGIFGNKAAVLRLCETERAILLDSDNRIDRAFLDVIYRLPAWDDNVIYCAEQAEPAFDYGRLAGLDMDVQCIRDLMLQRETRHLVRKFLNTSNFFVAAKQHAASVEGYLDVDVHAGDSISFAYLWLQRGGTFRVVPDLVYHHRVHDESSMRKSARKSMRVVRGIQASIVTGRPYIFPRKGRFGLLGYLQNALTAYHARKALDGWLAIIGYSVVKTTLTTLARSFLRKLYRWSINTVSAAKLGLHKRGIDLNVGPVPLYPELIGFPRYKKTTVTLDGAPFVVADAKSFRYSFLEIFRDGIYSFETDCPAPCIVDCGSNYGTSIVYFKKQYPGSKIVALEPDPGIFDILKCNISRRNYHDVVLVNKAVSGTAGAKRFYREGADAGRIFEMENAKDIVEVEAIELDSLLEGKVDMLKLDIEGEETDVLLSSKRLCNARNIFVEYHSFAARKQSLGLILEAFSDLGFRYFVQTVFCPGQPLLNRSARQGMDLQLNIYARQERP